MQMRGLTQDSSFSTTFRKKVCDASIVVKMDNFWDTGPVRNPRAGFKALSHKGRRNQLLNITVQEHFQLWRGLDVDLG